MDGYKHYLLLIPLNKELGADAALTALGRLGAEGALGLVSAVACLRVGDILNATEKHVTGAMHIANAAFLEVLSDLLDQDRSAARVGPDGRFSDSFASEARELVNGREAFIAAVLEGMDVKAAVSSFRAYPDVRLVYGVIPEPVVEALSAP